ncbi:uncharacterized protein BYT42DRAFT_284876 [Radiomyces spectabilis]|uniref:uncharacterized protein n=1 Tax=Radiomyces spectabilis TaxID=64574 RepID=UPI00221EA467|nr:uncharacterized protein BYT42DRAFT_284876 [Radiomyces spectabilis]KAI8380885.1 hypothetical protein BYT42DRAFT_284876 [Radiomyces spectabilis]
MTNVVVQLESELHRLELLLRNERSRAPSLTSSSSSESLSSSSSPPSLPSPIISRLLSPASSFSSITSQPCQTDSLMSLVPYSNGSPCQCGQNDQFCQCCQNAKYEWNLSIVDGQLRLETGIKSVHELITFSQTMLRSLNPFTGDLENTAHSFKVVAPNGIMTLVRKYLSGIQVIPPLVRKSPSLLQDALFANPRPLVDQFVRIYFKCFNSAVPLFYEPTYMAYYNSLSDPFSCIVTMAMCNYVGSSSCKHIPFTPDERRRLGEYFFSIWKDLLGETFDDPNRRLETVMSINLITKYLQHVLRISESQKYAAMAHLICQDLRTYYADDRKPIVERALFQRHYVLAEHIRAMNEFLDDKEFVLPVIENVQFEVLPLESDLVKSFIEIFQHILRLIRHPYVVNLVRQFGCMHAGQEVEMTFETFFRWEEIIQQWWYTVPKYLRITANPIDLNTRIIIDSSVTEPQLMLIVFFQMFMINISSCLLHPIDNIHVDNHALLQLIQDHAVRGCLRGTQLLLDTAKKLTTSSLSCHFNTEFLLDAVDTLAILIRFPDPTVADKARGILEACLLEVKSALITDGHWRSMSFSSSIKVNQPEDYVSLIKQYDQYPLPFYALLCHVLKITLNDSGFILQ